MFWACAWTCMCLCAHVCVFMYNTGVWWGRHQLYVGGFIYVQVRRQLQDPSISAFQGMPPPQMAFGTWTLGFELKSLCLHRKHFSSWTTAPAFSDCNSQNRSWNKSTIGKSDIGWVILFVPIRTSCSSDTTLDILCTSIDLKQLQPYRLQMQIVEITLEDGIHAGLHKLS